MMLFLPGVVWADAPDVDPDTEAAVQAALAWLARNQETKVSQAIQYQIISDTDTGPRLSTKVDGAVRTH